MVQYARAEGDAVRARHGSISKKVDGREPERVTHIGMLLSSSEIGAQNWSPKVPKYESVNYVGETEGLKQTPSNTDVK